MQREREREVQLHTEERNEADDDCPLVTSVSNMLLSD
jgi:hypothetical protein